MRAATVSNTQALICTVAEEYPALVAGAAFLEEAHVKLLLPSLESAVTCTDKWQFAECLRAAALPAPATGLGTADGVPGPWVVKPRFGRGSRDVFYAAHQAGPAATPSSRAPTRSCRPRSTAASSPATC